jgi:microcystin-dependent protein
MSSCYIGEIRMFAGTFAPVGWHMCDGSLLSIAENSTLFNLIGTTYGGDGQSTFGLPDLRSRVPIHQGSAPGGTYVLGGLGGSEQVTLTVAQLPKHTHPFSATQNAGNQPSPVGFLPAANNVVKLYEASAPNTALAPASILPAVGGNQPHENRQPYLCLNFIISLEGVYPSPN